jgi:hypothetical protein
LKVICQKAMHTDCWNFFGMGRVTAQQIADLRSYSCFKKCIHPEIE